jgi:hypothetical protein
VWPPQAQRVLEVPVRTAWVYCCATMQLPLRALPMKGMCTRTGGGGMAACVAYARAVCFQFSMTWTPQSLLLARGRGGGGPVFSINWKDVPLRHTLWGIADVTVRQ